MAIKQTDHDRRRLTVVGADAIASGLLGKEEVSQGHFIEALGLEDAILVASTTDKAGARVRSYTEKDQIIRTSDGSEETAKRLKQEVIDNRIAFGCKKGMKEGAANQDSFSVLVVKGKCALYAVYDGHGPHGEKVSEKAKDLAVSKFMSHPKRDESPGEAFVETFEETQRILTEMNAKNEIDAKQSGTTCTMAYHNFEEKVITIAHAGDSRAIVGLLAKKGKESAEEMTTDHKPDLPGEKARIEASGGRVVFDGFYNHRVFAKGGMYPGLNMSRALGDCVAHKEVGLSATPDIKVLNLETYSAECRPVLLIASDGVWEFLQNHDAIDEIKAGLSKSMNAGLERLCKTSYDKWMDDSDGEITDDITAILIDLA